MLKSQGAPNKQDALLVKGQHGIVINLRTKGVIGTDVNDSPRILKAKAQNLILANWDPFQLKFSKVKSEISSKTLKVLDTN